MKAIKYFVLGAMMIGFGAPAMAQNNNAVIEEVSKLIKTHGDGEAIKAIFKANKKNPEVLLGMGRAYLEVKDTANASKYANLALARNKKYAKAFILLGDIAVFADDGGKAAEQNQQNILILRILRDILSMQTSFVVVALRRLLKTLRSCAHSALISQ